MLFTLSIPSAPIVFRQPLTHGFFRRGADRVQHVASILERTTEDYETVVDEGIHEPRVLIPTVLLTQVTRPIPGPPRSR